MHLVFVTLKAKSREITSKSSSDTPTLKVGGLIPSFFVSFTLFHTPSYVTIFQSF